MRRLTSLVATVCVGLLVAWAQPQLRWLEMEHDFGVINEEDGMATCQMRLVNDGDSALLITRVRTSCGCTVTEHPKQAIAPGDTAAITVIYNPYNRPGAFSKDIFVHTNAKPARTMVSISGNVISRPETLIERYPVAIGGLRFETGSMPLGELTREQRRLSYFTAYNASATDTLLLTVGKTPTHVQVAASPDTLPPGHVGAISVHYMARKAPQWGLNIDTLAVSCRPLGRSGTTAGNLYVMAQVNEDFSNLTGKQRRDAPQVVASADKLMFAPGETTVTFTITNHGKNDLELRRLYAIDPAIAAVADRKRVKAGKCATVTVTVRPEQLQQPVLNDRLTIVSNDPSQPNTVLRLVGQF